MGNHKVLKTSGTNLRYSMYEFIDAVKMYSILWDREHEDFHNRELRDQAWKKIGQQLCKNFDAASEAEKQEITKTLLKRWKNTRDSYLRVQRLRHNASGTQELARASYIYEKELSFLLDIKNESLKEDHDTKSSMKRKRFSLLKAPVKRHDSGNKSAEADDQNTLNEGLRSVLEDLDYTQDTSTLPDTSAALAKSEVSTFAVDFNTSTLNASTSSNAASSAPTDPDQAFFESIKPHMQNMSADQKLDFQIEVLKILRNFRPNPN